MTRFNDKYGRPGDKLGPLNGDPAACHREHRRAHARVQEFLRHTVGPGTRVYIRRMKPNGRA